MKRAAIGLAGLFAAVGCQGPPTSADTAQALGGHRQVIPKPVPGGDFFPDLPHHRAGIIHQFYPLDPPVGDGPWAEPNGITDFNGWFAQVFMGGTAVDNKGNQYIVDVDNRVYVGEYIGTNGERAYGEFCEI